MGETTFYEVQFLKHCFLEKTLEDWKFDRLFNPFCQLGRSLFPYSASDLSNMPKLIDSFHEINETNWYYIKIKATSL